MTKLAEELDYPARADCRQSWNIAPASRLLFNARSEKLSERPTFRSAFESRRRLIPANGSYERQAAPGGKTPVWIHREDDQPFAFAGLYAHDSAAIITADANCLMRPTHHRMPVILTPDERAAWLDRRAAAATANGYRVGVPLRDCAVRTPLVVAHAAEHDDANVIRHSVQRHPHLAVALDPRRRRAYGERLCDRAPSVVLEYLVGAAVAVVRLLRRNVGNVAPGTP